VDQFSKFFQQKIPNHKDFSNHLSALLPGLQYRSWCLSLETCRRLVLSKL